MALLDCTRKLLEIAEQVSGRPVRVQEDAGLTVLARVKMARHGAPMHLITYRPIPGRQPDYHICYQCGFVIRLFENPPEARFEFAMAPAASEKMDAFLQDRSVPQQVRMMKDTLINGLLTQLRSVPIGLRIDDWLWSLCPDLRDEQIGSSRLQLQQNVEALSPAVRKSFPQKVVKANTAMNAAFALFWSTKLGDAAITLPYRSIAADLEGKALLDIFDKAESKPTGDWALVDRWAEELGLLGWYKWIPYNLED